MDRDNKRLDENTNTGSMRREVVVGRNPVLALLRGTRGVETLYIGPGEQRGSILQIKGLAREKGVVIKQVSDEKLASLAGGASHQGVAAALPAHEYATMQDIYDRAAGEPLFVVILDEIEDPHNLGAILRSAECAGAHGVICPKRRSAPLSPVVAKAAAGALESIPLARVNNLSEVIEELKEKGVWVYAADMSGSCYCQQSLTGPIALVIGSEGSGVRRLVKERCDGVLSLPLYGSINSLNASVAAGVLLYEISRQRHGISAVSPAK